MRGARGDVEITVFDYYEYHFLARRAGDEYTFACLQNSSLNLPAFALEPGSFGVKFESHPRFSEVYALEADDEQTTRSVFTPSVLDFFSTNEGLAVQASGQRLVVFIPDAKVMSSDRIPALIEQSLRIAELFKARR